MPRDINLNNRDLPKKEGVYFIRNPALNKFCEIEVYKHPIKGLCCFSKDFGSSGTEGVDDTNDCHVSVQNTGLEFIMKVGELH